jgi:hypothetical protein
MKKGETIDHHIVLIQAIHLRETPGCMNLITMRQADELGPPRCAARMEKSAQTVSLDDRDSNPNLSSRCSPDASANSIIGRLGVVGFPSTTTFFSDFARSTTA